MPPEELPELEPGRLYPKLSPEEMDRFLEDFNRLAGSVAVQTVTPIELLR